MAEQKIVEKARKILVDELGYPDPADCDRFFVGMVNPIFFMEIV